MSFTEQEVSIEGAFTLAGTLTLPEEKKDKHPVLVMVHGSGKLDRDENTRGMRINAFKELSELAAAQGFATLRYDKRGVGKSEGNFLETGLQDLLDDAVEAVTFAAAHPAIDENQLLLLGHSEGCLLAPAIFQRHPVQGMILLAGSAEPLADTTAWQRAEMKKDMQSVEGFQGFLLRLLKVEQKLEKMNEQAIKKVEASDKAVIRFKGKKLNAKWNKEHGDFDVREHFPAVTCPVLAITGSKDVQVKPGHAAEICALVSGPCKSRIIENMTHLLRKTDKDHKISTILKDYKKQVKKAVDPELKEQIVTWLSDWKENRENTSQ